MTRLVFLLVAACAVVCRGHPTTGSTLVVEGVPQQDKQLTDNAKPSEEGSFGKPKITSMHVESNVTLRYAKTLVTSRVSNPASRANEVTFSIVIPETAFITGFSMEIEGKVYEAYVKEKAEAKKVYQSAVNSGQAAAHVAVQARDSNHFTVSVNVEPQSKAVFRLTYEELLTRRLGLYHLVMNINPGQLVEDLAVDVNIKESAPIQELFVPQLRTGNEVDAEPSDAHNEYSTQKISDDHLEAHIHFAPNKTQQEDLMRIFKKRQHETTTPTNSYFPFLGSPSTARIVEDEGLKGQFVVQYDVNRDVKGEVLLNDGYFVHFFAPSDLKPLNKHVIFVLDVSGSMAGRKIAQLKDAMVSILQDLHSGDYFSIIDFSYTANVYDLDDPAKNAKFHQSDPYYYGEEVVKKEPEVPPPPKPATPDNIVKAKGIIDQLRATGGTNIHDALTTALKVANRGIMQSKIEKNDSVSESAPLPSPMVIFLTDGDPTVGDTNLERILEAVKSLNTMSVPLFSLAFGEDADRSFLRRVSLQNSGFMRHIYEAADAAQQLKHFYRQVASPLLANITLTYPQEQIEEESLTKKDFNYFFMGSELVVAGRLLKKEGKEVEDAGFHPRIGLVLKASSISGPIDFIPIVPEDKVRKHFWPLERMWAYITIKQLLDEKDAKNGDGPEENSPAKKALQLALKYSFVTPLTSLVVVKPNSTAAVDAESVEAGGGRPGAGYALPLMANFAPPSNRMMYMQRPQLAVSYSMPIANSQSSMTSSITHQGYIQIPDRTFWPGSAPYMPSNSQSRLSTSSMDSPDQSYMPGAAHYMSGNSLSYVPAAGFGGAAGAPASGIYSAPGLSGASGIRGGSPGPIAPFPPGQPEFDKIASFEQDTLVEMESTVPLTSTARITTVAVERHTLMTPEANVVNVTEPEPKQNRLALYGLEAFPWLEQYLDPKEDSISLPRPSKDQLSYKLKNKSLTYPAAEESACNNSVGGGAGSCRYLTQCTELSAGLKDIATYLAHSCDAQGFAGICCAAEHP